MQVLLTVAVQGQGTATFLVMPYHSRMPPPTGGTTHLH
jgi:hypothetical protein